jgi:hypothetical protein
MDSLGDLVDRLTALFWELPRGARVASLALIGVVLTVLAVPKFEEELLTAIFYMVLAVVFFWMAIAPFM